MPQRLTLKVTGGGRHIRVDRELDADVTQDALEQAADAAADALGLSKKSADRRGSATRPKTERFGPSTGEPKPEPEE